MSSLVSSNSALTTSKAIKDLSRKVGLKFNNITVEPLEDIFSPTGRKGNNELEDKKVMSFVESPDAHLVDEELIREELRIKSTFASNSIALDDPQMNSDFNSESVKALYSSNHQLKQI